MHTYGGRGRELFQTPPQDVQVKGGRETGRRQQTQQEYVEGSKKMNVVDKPKGVKE